MRPVSYSPAEISSKVFRDSAGNIFYRPSIHHAPELLASADEVCGISFLNTGPDDPLRDMCIVHDKMYTLQAFFAERGWSRKQIDEYFYHLRKQLQNRSPQLEARSALYYRLVRAIGWIPFGLRQWRERKRT